jgi:hypothetical protein
MATALAPPLPLHPQNSLRRLTGGSFCPKLHKEQNNQRYETSENFTVQVYENFVGPSISCLHFHGCCLVK